MRHGWFAGALVGMVGATPVAADEWGALFRDINNGYVGYGYKLPSAAAAEARAQRECRSGGNNCSLLFAVHGRAVCAAVATNDDNKDVYVAEGTSEADASARALAACNEGGSNDCGVDQALCADRRPRR